MHNYPITIKQTLQRQYIVDAGNMLWSVVDENDSLQVELELDTK